MFPRLWICFPKVPRKNPVLLVLDNVPLPTFPPQRAPFCLEFLPLWVVLSPRPPPASSGKHVWMQIPSVQARPCCIQTSVTVYPGNLFILLIYVSSCVLVSQAWKQLFQVAGTLTTLWVRAVYGLWESWLPKLKWPAHFQKQAAHSLHALGFPVHGEPTVCGWSRLTGGLPSATALGTGWCLWFLGRKNRVGVVNPGAGELGSNLEHQAEWEEELPLPKWASL